MAASVNAHDLMSLVAAATLIYYRTTPHPSTLRDQKARDEIHRLSLALASMVPLYRIDASGRVFPLSGAQLQRLVADIEKSHVLEPGRGVDLAIHTTDLTRAIEALLKRGVE
jgi:hypothetical protein